MFIVVWCHCLHLAVVGIICPIFNNASQISQYMVVNLQVVKKYQNKNNTVVILQKWAIYPNNRF